MSYVLKNLPVEILNLDEPSDKRWIFIIEKYKEEIKITYDILYDRIYQIVGAYGKYAFDKLLYMIVNGYGKRNFYYEELMSISKTLNIPFHRVVAVQYGYELFTACTSAITKGEITGKTYHLRTMDWNDNSLRPLTIQLKVIKNGKIVADTTTWVGFIGFYTIVKPDVCSVSVNYRRNKIIEPHRNFWGIIMGRTTISYLIREAVLNNEAYDDIINSLKYTNLSAPCYITIACKEFNKSMVLVRDRCDCYTYMMNEKQGFLVQANNDPWDHKESTNRNKSIERKQVFENKVLNKNNNIDDSQGKAVILKNFLQEPILKFNNIYCNIMVPSDINEPNYTQYIVPNSDMELMIEGSILKFWKQIPADAYVKY